MNGQTKQAALFPLGQTVATPGALEALELAEETAVRLLARHLAGKILKKLHLFRLSGIGDQ